MKAAIPLVGAGASFVGAVVLGLYLGWLLGGRVGHPELAVAGLFVGMLFGGIVVGMMVARFKL